MWPAGRDRPAGFVAKTGSSPVPLVRMWRSWTSLWWRVQSRIISSVWVSPPLATCDEVVRVELAGAVQPGYWQCFERFNSARSWA